MGKINILYSMLCRDFHDIVVKNIRKNIDIGNEIAITEMYMGDTKKFNNTYECGDAYCGRYYKYKEYNLAPAVDETLINQMAPYALEIIKMMDRPQSWDMVFEDRMQLYFEQIKFWNFVLDYYEINAVVFFNVPHEFFDYVIYCLCKIKNIRMTIYYMASPFHNRSILFDDIDNIGKGLDTVIEKYRLEYKDLTEDAIILEPECNMLYKKYLNILQEKDKEKLRKENPWTMLNRNFTLNNIAYMEIRAMLEKKYHKKIDGQEVARELEKYLVGEKKLQKKPYQIKAYLRTREMLEYYEKLISKPEKGEKYILFALQNQPEATTSPLAGGIFSNQLIAIEMLAKNLPQGVMLYVKEHPSQAYMARTKEYYKKIRRMKNVRLMPIEANQYELMKNAIATATATGTIALESAVMGKPCIIFGKFIYNYLPNTLPVRKNDECKKAIEKVVNGEVNVTIKDVKIFFKALYEYSEPGNVGYWNYNKVKNAKEVSCSIISDIERGIQDAQ